MNRYVYPFFLCLALCPLFHIVHECGHYLTAAAFGGKPTGEFARVMYHFDQVAPKGRLLATAAGPAVDVLLAVGGFCWLRSLRRGRLEAAPTFTDWLATSFISRSAGPLTAFLFLVGGAADIATADEVSVSLQLGLPRWVVPVLEAGMVLALIVAVIRLHPRRDRLVPFGCALFGYLVGFALVIVFGIVIALWRGAENPLEAENLPDHRPALDAGTGVSLQFGHQRPGASEAGCSAAHSQHTPTIICHTQF